MHGSRLTKLSWRSYTRLASPSGASAPFSAIRVIHQIASDERERYPLVEHVLKKEIYVGDV